MRITNALTFNDDPILGPAPHVFYGSDLPDGTKEPWKSAPLGSIYINTFAGMVAWYFKNQDTGAQGDWTGLIYGGDAVNGASEPWASAPLGSMYVRTASGLVAWYMKKADTGATTDWKEVTTAV